MPYSVFLPTYTASAFHHGKLDKKWATDLPTALKEAKKFSEGPYLEILYKGNMLNDFERQSAAKQIAMLTGLSEDFVLRNDLRIEAGRFRSELLRDKQLVLDRLDTRVTAKTGGRPPRLRRVVAVEAAGGEATATRACSRMIFAEANARLRAE